MKISEFVAESLSEIVLGIQTAKLNVAEIASIAPGSVNGKMKTIEEFVEFEVSVAVKVSKERSGALGGNGSVSAKIAIVEAKVGVDGSGTSTKTTADETLSRLKFRVPVQFNAHFRADMENNPAVWAGDRLALEEVSKRMNDKK